MRRFLTNIPMITWSVLLLFVAALSYVNAQVVPQPGPPTPIACAYNSSPVTLTSGQAGWVQCDSTGQIKTSGGGGGGLSVTDQAAFSQGVSSFTPGGGVFNDTATLTSGQQGTFRMTTKRAQIIDTDTSGNALYSALTGPSTCLAATAYNTNSYSNAATGYVNCTLNGNLYVAAATWGTAVLGAATAVGTPASGNVITTNSVDTPVNTNQTGCSASTSASPSTATTLLAASATHRKLLIKVEGANVVCFNNVGGTAAIGSADTFCLNGASSANAGNGGSYSTPPGMTDGQAVSMISASASQLVTCRWQ